ncbi:hypothetical protein DL96DRAFT_1610647 [Flagelloscypha sp. PMI_526]|nr:hypothetical protein DL96DRAFT_1610647 [Flagelloscypha sp. PMI_526]
MSNPGDSKYSQYSGPIYDFPPFPSTPDGVTLISFASFQEHGISIHSDPKTGEEIDGLGIPTIEIRAKHLETDECKSDAIRYQKQKAQAKLVQKAKANAFQAGLPFWEQWMEAEEARWMAGKTDYPKIEDRFLQASKDFHKHRNWPPIPDTGKSLQELFDHFRRFTGLISMQSKKMARTSDEEDVPGTSDRTEEEHTSNIIAEDPAGEIDEDDQSVDKESNPATRNMDLFLKNPERRVSEYLSSYLRNNNMLWVPADLRDVPHLVHIFLTYLYKTDVFIAAKERLALEKAITVSSKAIEELPLTSQLSRALPCSFSQACRGTFGSKLGWDFGETSSPTAVAGVERSEDVDRLSTKSAKSDPVEVMEPVLIAEGPNIVSISETRTIETLDMDLNEDEHSRPAWLHEYSSGEATPEDTEGSNGRWAETLDLDELARSLIQEERAKWEDGFFTAEPKLIGLLGPTTFPLTHRTGVIEYGLRRVKNIVQPEVSATANQLFEEELAVESDLVERFARITMTPWKDEDEYSKPFVLENSCPSKKLKVHDPEVSEITALIDSKVAEFIKIGMGICAYWVQLVRLSDDIEKLKDGDQEKPKSRKKKSTTVYWYLDTVVSVYPTYHVAPT